MKKINKNLFIIFTFILISFIIISAVQAENADSDLFIPEVDYKYYSLDNGLELFVFEDHKVPIVNFSIYYDVGSIDEKKGLTGISHLLEHLMFLGTDTLNKGQISEMIKDVGGSENASTAHWRTKYYETLPSSNLELAVAIEADRMRNLNISEKEFQREKEVVIQERRMYIENDAFSSAVEEINAAAFKNTPLEHGIIGWKEDLEQITLDDIYNYYENYYVPSNAVISISGDVTGEKAYQLVKKYFGDYESKKVKKAKFKFPEQKEEKVVKIRKVTRVPYIVMFYKLPSGDNPDMEAVDFLHNILINNSTSRIIEELKQKQNILLDANAYRTSLSVPNFSRIVLIPNSEINIEKVVQGFEKELQKIIENGVSEEEIKIMKKGMTKNLILAQKNISNFSDMIIGDYIKYGRPEFYREKIERINSVTEADIIDAAKKYFNKSSRTIGYIMPKK
ncbi:MULTISPECIES: pitrilysin family protein [unclassified Halanaerobium]|uniref:M16 family metallopeptidase n=1 Tax=unclassified Halanaerobium TaxID=2641197 RepID=UPI000E14505E|nr:MULTISPECIES: pitrilysin family protein [unclassified Halanaerobium]RCW47729.1 zinc protease [Halanaerobium sp. MA284_MarDTE_T2]RCW87984.1 zinc protease [Halanaerobium sp. DL-01]